MSEFRTRTVVGRKSKTESELEHGCLAALLAYDFPSSCRMALGSLFLVCVVARVLGTARCSDGDQSECPCSGIPQWPLTEPPPQDCHRLNRTFRYTCIKGYLRTAGTSNLIKCKPGSSRWSSPTLKCKLDPRGGTAHASNSTDADAVTASIEKHRNTSGPGYSLFNGSSNDTSLPQSRSSTTGSGITIAVVSSISVAVAALFVIGLLLHKMRKAQPSRVLQTTTESIPLNEAT